MTCPWSRYGLLESLRDFVLDNALHEADFAGGTHALLVVRPRTGPRGRAVSARSAATEGLDRLFEAGCWRRVSSARQPPPWKTATCRLLRPSGLRACRCPATNVAHCLNGFAQLAIPRDPGRVLRLAAVRLSSDIAKAGCEVGEKPPSLKCRIADRLHDDCQDSYMLRMKSSTRPSLFVTITSNPLTPGSPAERATYTWRCGSMSAR